MYTIGEAIEGVSDHLKADFTFELTEDVKNIFFKYQSSSSDLPSSLITTFRIVLYKYTSEYKVFCTNVLSTETDEGLKETLKALKQEDSSCIEVRRGSGYSDAIIRLDKDKTKLGIMIKENKTGTIYEGRLTLRVKERKLAPDELKIMDADTYTLFPFTVDLPTFRNAGASKVLFYSIYRNLEMFYAGTSLYPDELFSGNILSVYTNPDMIRMKYNDAKIMTLLLGPSNAVAQDFQFEVKLLESNYLLDYYVSSNPEGRPLNSPLLINMTECSNPYYVILNYNKPEERRSLILDQIYGKVESISVAEYFTKVTWDEMIANDMPLMGLSHLRLRLTQTQLP